MIDFEKTIELYRDTILLDEEGDKGERYEKYELIVTLVDCYVKIIIEDADKNMVYNSDWFETEYMKYEELNKPYYTKLRKALYLAHYIFKLKNRFEYCFEVENNKRQKKICEYFACREIAFELSDRIVSKKCYMRRLYHKLSDGDIKKNEKSELTDDVIKEIEEHELEDKDVEEIENFEIKKMKEGLRKFLRALMKNEAHIFGMIDVEGQRHNIDKVVSFFYKSSLVPENNLVELYCMSLVYLLGKAWNDNKNKTDAYDIFSALKRIFGKSDITIQYNELFGGKANPSIDEIIVNYAPSNICIDEITSYEEKVYASMVFFVMCLVDKKKSNDVRTAVDYKKLIFFVEGALKSATKTMKILIDKVYKSNTICECEKNNGLFYRIKEDDTEYLLRSLDRLEKKMFNKKKDIIKRRNRKVRNPIMRDYCNGMYNVYCQINNRKKNEVVSYDVLKSKFYNLQEKYFGEIVVSIDQQMSSLSKKSVGYFANLLMMMRICMGPVMADEINEKMWELIEEKKEKANIAERFALIKLFNDLDVLSYIDFVYELYEVSYTTSESRLDDILKKYWCRTRFYKEDFADIVAIILAKLTRFDSLSIFESKEIVETVLGEANKIEKRWLWSNK